MANTIGWGKGTQNNSNGWGKFQNTIGAASIYENSYAGETVLIGTSAAFSYSASSFHQGEADPTPTITGTAGGTFSATPSGLSINTSTGTIDLDNSTIQSYTITYTVSGVSANQTLAVTASPFIANDFSMEFDSASSQYIDAGNIGTFNPVSFSTWLKPTNNGRFIKYGSSASAPLMTVNVHNTNDLRFYIFNVNRTFSSCITQNQWNHIVIVRSSSLTGNVYVNGVSQGDLIGTGSDFSQNGDLLIGDTFNGKIDEFAVWNVALSSDAVTEIYNATANNTGKVLDLNTDSGNYNASSNLVYFNRLGD